LWLSSAEGLMEVSEKARKRGGRREAEEKLSEMSKEKALDAVGTEQMAGLVFAPAPLKDC